MYIFSLGICHCLFGFKCVYTQRMFSCLQKLLEISRLKEQRANGKPLEINQIEKMKKEDQLIKELQELTL